MKIPARKKPSSESGFTLVELLVVMVIITILVAIAIPMFLNQRKKGWEASVKSDLNNAAIAQISYFVENRTFTGQLDDLYDRGYNTTDNVVMSIPVSGNSFCMQAFHNGDPDGIWHNDNGSGTPIPREGPCP